MSEAILMGLLVGAGVQTVLFGAHLYEFLTRGVASADVSTMLLGVPFGFAGVAAVYAAMLRKRRFYWWPIVMMFCFGRYPLIILAVAGDRQLPGTFFDIALVYLVSMIEPLLGSVTGAIADRGFLALASATLRLPRQEPPNHEK